MKIADMVKLLRPWQWYKNTVIFLAIIFSKNLFRTDYLAVTLLGFMCLCMISSANYTLNDIIDCEKDREHPFKRKRPVASKKISKTSAYATSILLFCTGAAGAYLLSVKFFGLCIGFALISNIYTFFLKNIAFADLLAIASNFVLRAVCGAIIIDVYVSPWLIVGVFFLALFLAAGKRYGELKMTGQGSSRKALQGYSRDLLFSLFNMFMTILIIVFVLFSFSSGHDNMIWTAPLFIFLILRYYSLILSDSTLAQRPELAIRDMPLVVTGIIFTALVAILL